MMRISSARCPTRLSPPFWINCLRSTRRGVRASVLSRRWAHLPWLIARPYISVFLFLPRRETTFEPSDLSRAIESLRKATRRFLASATTVECLALQFILTNKLIFSIRQLLGNAVDNGRVNSLVFDIMTQGKLKRTGKKMLQHAQRLTGFVRSSPDLFGLLTKLQLENLWLIDSDVAVPHGHMQATCAPAAPHNEWSWHSASDPCTAVGAQGPGSQKVLLLLKYK